MWVPYNTYSTCIHLHCTDICRSYRTSCEYYKIHTVHVCTIHCTDSCRAFRTSLWVLYNTYTIYTTHLCSVNCTFYRQGRQTDYRPSYKSEYLIVIILIINLFKFSHTLCSLNDIMKATQHPNPVNVHKMCLYWHETTSYFP